MDNKILLVIQFWEGDKAQAMALMRFIADLQPEHSDEADVLFMRRFDCEDDPETVKYVAKKFNTYTKRSRLQAVGWPDGCNALWFDAMTHVWSQIRDRKSPHYKAIFTFEADGCPMRPDWIQRFSAQWDRLAVFHKLHVAGAFVERPAPHVNGNAFFSGHLNFLHWVADRYRRVPTDQGWDYYLAKDFKNWGWAEMPGLVSIWNTPSLSPDGCRGLLDRGVIWEHGVKDSSVLDFSRARLL